MATTIALKGANPAYFPNVNDAGMPVLNQKALDALLTKYNSNSLNAGQYRDNYNAFGWNVKSDGSSVMHGPAIFGLDMGNIPSGGMGSFTRGVVKAGTNTAATPADYQKAATQLGLNYSDYVKPQAFVPSAGPMGSTITANSKNSKQYTDPVTGKSYLASIDAKGNYVTSLNQSELYNAINDKSKDLYMVANALDRTGVAANDKSPHASVLFRADGSGNLLPVTLPTGQIAATPYQAVGVSHAGWQGQLAELAPILGFAALAVGAPYLSSLFSGGAAATTGLTAGLEAGQIGALTAGQVGAAGAAGAATAGAIAIPTLSQIGAAMLEGSLISGGIAAVTGGDIGRAMLTGALTGGASSYVSGALASGALGSIAQNEQYCSKAGQLVEHGIKPISNDNKGRAEKLRWQRAKDLAKAGNLDEIDADIYIRCYSTLKNIAKDNLTKPPPIDVKCFWIHGATGTVSVFRQIYLLHLL